jgi:FkbM family methyltransferase
MSRSMIERFIKRSVRRFGLDVKRYHEHTCHEARMRLMLSAHRVNLVLDVGANAGQYGQSLREIGYAGRIVSFEPLPGPWKELKARSERDPLWEVAPRAAIGDREGETEFHVAANSESSSVLPMLDAHLEAAPGSGYIDSLLVPLRRLDSSAAEFLTEDSVLFIKIDTQGFESQVLDGAGVLLKRAVGLQLELTLTPLYESQCLYDDLIRRMKTLGFEVWDIASVFVDARTGRLLAMDVTFFREESLSQVDQHHDAATGSQTEMNGPIPAFAGKDGPE